MNRKLEIAQSLYFVFRDSVNKGKMKESDFMAMVNNSPDTYRLTEFELREAEPDFKKFIIDNKFLIPSVDLYGFTEPFQDFKYSYDRLNLHLDFSKYAFDTLRVVSITSFEKTLEDLEIPEDSELNDWHKFQEKLYLTRDEIIYEQGLISLLTVFEVYISHILQWIFKQDEDSRHKIKVNIEYDEVLENIDEIIPFLILKKIEQIRSWEDRIDTIQRKPIQIKITDK